MKSWAGMLLAAAVYCGTFAGADELLRDLKLDENGAFTVGEVGFGLAHWGKDWKSFTKQKSGAVAPAAGFPRRDAQTWSLKGQFNCSEPFELEETLEQKADDSVNYSALLSSVPGVESATAALVVTLPLEKFFKAKIRFDGQELALPEERQQAGLFSGAQVKKIEIPDITGRIEIEGDFTVYVQDEREYNLNEVAIRLMLNPAKGLLTKAGINAVIRHEKYRTAALDLSAVANQGFQDETPDDRQGGWTDQGPTNDLRQFKPGKQVLGGVEFNVVDPAANGGKSCLVFAGPERDYFLKTAAIPAGGQKFANLYLLHALAWPPRDEVPVGRIDVKYADGTEQQTEVIAYQDVGNWWNPGAKRNASVVWSAENASAYTGLYLSRFKVQDKPIETITLTGTQQAVWMVAGISGGEEVPFRIEQPYYIVEGPDWKPLKHELLPKAGGALDMSFLDDAPAGKYGPVVVRNGHFEFTERPGTPVRFFGANTCFSANFQSQAECDFLADQLARLGYNTVRFHHYDATSTSRKAADSTTLDPENIDKLDYLFHACKQRGLYISIDLYTVRQTRQGEFPEVEGGLPIDNTNHKYKPYAAVSDAIFGNWKAFAGNLLTHVNPYTGLAWKDDPALFSISLINEGNLNSYYPHAKAGFDRAFAEWLEKRKLSAPQAGEARNCLFNRFLVDIQTELSGKCAAFVRSLGTKALLTDINMQGFIPLGLVRDSQAFDYVDDHTYWDHPSFVEKPWRLPFSYSCKSATAALAAVPRRMMTARLFGKPFTVTEWNYCSPNPYRAEGGPLMGAYAALQDWDLLHRFTYSHSKLSTQKPHPAGTFDIAADPLSLMAERIVGFLYRRGDVQTAKTEIPFVFSENCLNDPRAFDREGMPEKNLSLLGLLVKIGGVNLSAGRELPAQYACAVGREDFDAARFGGRPYFKTDSELFTHLCEKGVIDRKQYEYEGQYATRGMLDSNLEAGRFTSETGEITVDAPRGFFRVVTPKSECLILPANATEQGACLQAANRDVFCTLSVHALDEKPLRESSRLVLFHLTDVRNNKMKFRNPELTVVEKWGDLPHLVRRGETAVTLQTAVAGLKVWALDLAGERIKPMPAEFKDGRLTFTANTVQPEGAFLAYEIALE